MIGKMGVPGAVVPCDKKDESGSKIEGFLRSAPCKTGGQ